MRYSRAFIPTVREVPSEAVSPSHILMIRAGLIRQLVSGVYSYLPLGYRALRKAENIVREEMDRSGAIELHMPALIPLELFEKTERVEAFGPILFRFKDQHGSELALGPTHEEVITRIVADHINSYKQLPLNLYQIQTKFRDEERPKSGILRTREFLMKDAYSFHTSVEQLDKTYKDMYDTYIRIFKRCGLPAIAVEAESGPIGGSVSHEFMVLTDVGEDRIVLCDSCGYAANLERAERKRPDNLSSDLLCSLDSAKGDIEDLPQVREVYTPGMKSIEQVSSFLNCRPEQMIKTLIYKTDEGKAVVALVRGDHEVNEHKLARRLGCKGVELADDRTIKELTGADVGFAGPVGLKADTIIIDYDVASIRDGVSGANKTDYHLTGIVAGRDFVILPSMLADIRNVVEGDLCPNCSSSLRIRRAIEVGHVFRLGSKYSEALGANYLDSAGRLNPMIMGCYGIGINRIIAAAIEIHHDDDGIIWPISIAPYEVELIALNISDENLKAVADDIYDKLLSEGIDVLYDDREVRPGVKFKDADLLGMPIRITIGPKGLAEGKAEVKLRREKDSVPVEISSLIDKVKEIRKQLYEELSS